MTKQDQFVVGIDYGTDSVRAILVNASNGEEMGNSVQYYPRWQDKKYCDPSRNQFRQHPLDYLESIETATRDALKKAGAKSASFIKGISIDTTGSTPAPVDRKGTPLAMHNGYKDNPNAMFILWKDHTAVKEAEEINHAARTWGGEDYTKYEGGVYSSEWFWAKILYVLRNDPGVSDAAYSWVEHCDWIPALLTGNTDPLTLKRSRCAAGHKAMWHESFGGLPEDSFFISIDPLLKGLTSRLYDETYTSDVTAGKLSEEWAGRLGLPEGIPVGVGAFDAHMGAVGGEIEPYCLSKVMGTSTCDMLVAPLDEVEGILVKGICGQVNGSIIPGMLGMEAGQSAFGDIYAWFADLLSWPLTNLYSEKKETIRQITDRIIPELSREAQKRPLQESGPVALDWLNGRRTPYADQSLKGAVNGLTLGTDAPEIFRSLVEATAFGSKKIIERFISEGVRIDSIIALGGVAKKSPYVVQTMADVLDRKIRVARSEQTVALGAAVFAATVAGIYPDVVEAQKAMGSGFDAEYTPDPVKIELYKKLYTRYERLGAFIEQETKI